MRVVGDQHLPGVGEVRGYAGGHEGGGDQAGTEELAGGSDHVERAGGRITQDAECPHHRGELIELRVELGDQRGLARSEVGGRP